MSKQPSILFFFRLAEEVKLYSPLLDCLVLKRGLISVLNKQCLHNVEMHEA